MSLNVPGSAFPTAHTQETDRMSSVRNALDFEPTPFNLPWNTSAEHGPHGCVETLRVESEPMNDEIGGM
jgi:hypothetical protein